MAGVDRSAFRQFRAPRGQGQSLVDPGWDELLPLVEANRQLAAGLPYDFGGTPLVELRAAARSSLLHAATGATVTDALERPLIMSGHQPELFHPGVWFKNFVLDRLARESAGRAVNLVIDSDLCRAPSISVPTGGATSPRVDAVAFDAASTPLPFEQRGVLDRSVLESFPDRVGEALAGLIDQPLVTGLWPRVVAAVAEGQPLGAAIGVARHALELDWGLAHSEAPISSVCDASPFRWFALDILLRLDDFHRAHNQALAEYRTAHKIRTPAQPIPDLHQRDGWLEAPFWVWTDDQPERRPLFARRDSGRLVLSDLLGGEWPIADAANFDSGAARLAELRFQHGVKIRSRALVTTVFARLLLADVFIHGIGGAKYDQVADRAAELYFGFAPPPHATATATLQLPIPHAPRISRDRPREIAAELRALQYHPERHLESPPSNAAAHIDAKRRWVQTDKTPANAAERHHAIESANAALQPFVEPRRAELLVEQERTTELLRTTAVLESREYAFCLFPADWLREQLRQVTAQA
ncbi:hypothetical protein Pla123a_48070 [Posidoniimonas polymericola]|uniref:Uncharacterized protein n=1 Tax=Posidoniimonas polymericola TaxID=2528002 RepID=A0A5C5XRN1_9BACT|nr:hypothetical protein [Posidoniimonas polymericola]TWT65896.1 hypothetical protein Pla123a_48070 [Posidoniimonas polymericola]